MNRLSKRKSHRRRPIHCGPTYWFGFASLALVLGLLAIVGCEGSQGSDDDDESSPGQSTELGRVHMIGDSITEGWVRYELFKLLVDGDHTFDFIGSLSDSAETIDDEYPEYKGKTFDSDHDGHSDHTTQMVADKMASILESIDLAEIALIHLGTNDYESAEGDYESIIPTSIESMGKIIGLLREKNPKVRIIVAQIIPMTREFKAENEYVQSLNQELASLAGELNTGASPLRIVDMNSGFGDEDLDDPWHPNEQGCAKMAKRWIEAISG